VRAGAAWVEIQRREIEAMPSQCCLSLGGVVKSAAGLLKVAELNKGMGI
jgi:hypothetical protein